MGEAVREEDGVAAVVQDVLANHLRERLLLNFLFCERKGGEAHGKR